MLTLAKSLKFKLIPNKKHLLTSALPNPLVKNTHLYFSLKYLQKSYFSTNKALAQQTNNLFSQGKHHEAIQTYWTYLSAKDLDESCPQTAEAYQVMGLAYDSLGQFDKALECHQKASL